MVKITIEIPINQLDIILKGLGELPAKESYAVIKLIHDQAMPQMPEKSATK